MNKEIPFRCHDADACALGQQPCPMPSICGCTAPACAVKEGTHKPAEAVHQIAEPAAVHPDDAAVDALAAAMKAKLEKQRAKGYGGWDTDCTQQRLSDMLRGHVDKGDPVDVANFCAFLVARGEGIAPTIQHLPTDDTEGSEA